MKKTVLESNTFLIVGLGNPGKKYMGTRHNVGFDFIETLANDLSIKLNMSKFNALIGIGRIDNKKIILAMPMTYMNLSGDAVLPIAKYYNINSENIIVCYDDIYLDTGKIRIRKNGSAGGHNGMKSIIARLRTENFPRIRVGVDKKPEYMDLADYVLLKFNKDELQKIDDAILSAVEACKIIINNDIIGAMNKFN